MRSEHCQLHGRTIVRWLYLTSCQRLFWGLLESSRTCTCATWSVLLRACRHWVQWWSHNTSWIQDIFTHLHSLHDLYAATATTFLMKNIWLLAGIFMYGKEKQWPGTHPPVRGEEVARRKSSERWADVVLCAGAAAQGCTRGLNFFVWNFAWDRLASRLYAATATPFRTWRYQLIIRYF